MIKVKVEKSGINYSKITINGHAMYDEFGKDIVCSAVSSIITTSINSILTLKEDSLEYTSNEGDVVIDVIEYNDVTNKLLDVMINLLKELENNYPDNIQVK